MAVSMVSPESTENMMVGLKLPKAPTQKPTTSTTLFTSSAGPASRVASRTAGTASPRKARRNAVK